MKTQYNPGVEVVYEFQALSKLRGEWLIIGQKNSYKECQDEYIEFTNWTKEQTHNQGWEDYRIVKVTTTRELV